MHTRKAQDPVRSSAPRPMARVGKGLVGRRSTFTENDAEHVASAPLGTWSIGDIPLFPPTAPQTKLAIGEAHGPLEREADRVADQVLRMPERVGPVGTSPLQLSRKCTSCEEEDTIQTMSAGARPSNWSRDTVSDVLRSPGQPLDAQTRAFFEPRFGHDFSSVRLHTDTRAAQSARSLNAHAYTVGHDVVFGRGQFAPGTHEGRRLLAHELTHVVQQSGARGLRSGSHQDTPRVSAGGASNTLMKKGFESTVQVCHRVLESRKFEVTNGGLRIVLLPQAVDRDVPNCRDFDYHVTLTRSVDWGFDKEIGTCEATTGGPRTFSFGNLSSGTYYLTVWRNFDHPHCCLEGDLMVFDEAVSEDSAGCTRHKSLSAMDIVHGALDLAGFIPVLGAIPDGVNAGIYALEGDWANAGLSAVAMVPAWGDGVKLGAIAGKGAIKVSEKAAFRLGEEGIAKGLKEVKAASQAEKAAVEATQGAAKTEKTVGKEAAAQAEKKEAKEAAQAEQAGKDSKKKKDKGSGGKWTCYGHSAVLQIPSALPENKCPYDGTYVDGPPVSAASEDAACLAAKHAFNAMMPRGCRPKHLACRCSKR
ncbi:eCIS core domain-containing protein [Myxococcus fulvus]|nr:DUF4157 domain-containing protein [Myxococcus fulvus]